MRKVYQRFIGVLLCISCFGIFRANAQTFVIPDTNFRLFLQDSFPAVLDGNGDLIIAAAASVTVDFRAINKNISNINGLQYFTSLKDIDLSYNNLTSLPDLSSITNMRDLILDHNDLDSLPPLISHSNLRVLKCDYNNLKKLPPLTNLSNLYRLFCRWNPLTRLPDLTGCTSLYHLLCTGSKIDSLPDFSTNTALGIIGMNGNPIRYVHDYSFLPAGLDLRINQAQLTFEDLWLLARHPDFDANFIYDPQDSIPVQGTFVFKELDTITLYLGFDDTVTASTYYWYKDGQLIDSTTTNRLKIFPATIQDAGKYCCKFKNSGHADWSSLTINTKIVEVNVTPCMYTDNLNYTVQESDCVKGVSIELEETDIVNGEMPFAYKLYNRVSKDTSYFISKLLTNLSPGLYDLFIIDQSQCVKTINNFISLQEQVKCDVVITPDGDGQNEQYFIDTPGNVKIYNVNGALVKNLNGPAYWNGQNDRGVLVPMGVYAIIIEGRDVTNITVIY